MVGSHDLQPTSSHILKVIEAKGQVKLQRVGVKSRNGGAEEGHTTVSASKVDFF